MARVTGVFYFQQTQTNNLIGEFANNGTDEILPESAIKNPNNPGFIGLYQFLGG